MPGYWLAKAGVMLVDLQDGLIERRLILLTRGQKSTLVA